MTNDKFHYPDQTALAGLESLTTPIWIFDVDQHRIWWANVQGVAFWEAESLQDLIERDFSTDSQTVRTRLRQIVDNYSSGTRVQDSWTLYPAGHPRSVTVTFTPIQIDDGRDAVLIEVVRIAEDIDPPESIRILEAARSTALQVSTYTLSGRLLVQNPAALAACPLENKGKDAGDGPSDFAARLADPDQATDILAQVSRQGDFDGEIQVLTKSGTRTHRIQARKGRDPVTGEFVAVISEEDVSEYADLANELSALNLELEDRINERTDALRRSEERYALAVETASIWDWDVGADEIFLSPRFAEQLGYKKDEFESPLRQATIRGLVHTEDLSAYDAEIDRHLREPDVPFYIEVRFNMKSGETRWFRGQGKAVVDDQGRVVRSVGLMTDITDRKALEVTLLESQRMQAIGQLTGGIAHDFNNLLTVIMGSAELLELSGQSEKELIDEILSATDRGAELTQQLLAFSRRQVLQPKVLMLDDLVDQMETMLTRVLGDNISIDASSDIGLWAVFADRAQVETAILKIAINAQDAMPQGGALRILCRNVVVRPGRLATQTEILPGEYVSLLLSDTGRGMSEGTAARAFEPFFTTKSVGKGSGLGLSMVYGFAKQSGGGVTIESSPDKGTSVTVFLPRHLGARDEPQVRVVT